MTNEQDITMADVNGLHMLYIRGLMDEKIEWARVPPAALPYVKYGYQELVGKLPDGV